MLINKGSLDGIKQGERAYFLNQTGTLSKPKLEKIAWGEVVKVKNNESLWLLHLVNNQKFLAKKPKLVLVPTNDIVRGRREFNILKKRRILTKSTDKKELIFEKKHGMPSKFVYKGDDYVEKDNIDREVPQVTEDVRVTSYDRWAKKKQLEYIDDYMSEIETKFSHPDDSPELAKEISRDTKEDVANSMIDNHVSKTNNLKYGLKGLYREQERSNGSPEISETITISNVYQKEKEKRMRKKILRPEVYHKLDRDGEMWSADFNDEQLRRYLIKTGIAEEEIKQKMALYEKSSNEVVIGYTSQITGAANSEDPNHQSKNYSLMAGFEYHLMRSSPSLKSYSILLFLENGIGHYDLGNGINGRFSEGSFGAILNWYFFNNPNSLNQYIWNLGVGYRRGNAKVTSSFLSKEYDFQMVGLPSFHLGVKYRFRSGDALDDDIPIGMGVFGKISSELLNLTSVSTVEADDGINGSITHNDVKFVIGLSVYF